MAHEERELTYKEADLEVRVWADYRIERLGYSFGARVKTPKGVYYVDRPVISQDPPSIGQFFEFAISLLDREKRWL